MPITGQSIGPNPRQRLVNESRHQPAATLSHGHHHHHTRHHPVVNNREACSVSRADHTVGAGNPGSIWQEEVMVRWPSGTMPKNGWRATYPVEVSCRGFVSLYTNRFLRGIGFTSAQVKMVVKDLPEEAEKGSSGSVCEERTGAGGIEKPGVNLSIERQLQGAAGRCPCPTTWRRSGD